VRNRVKRRIKEVLRLESSHLPDSGFSVVLIARKAINKSSFEELRKEITSMVSGCGRAKGI